MLQGTGSGVGKSLIAAGFCRLFKKRGYSVRPFKAQNMSLNSGVTKDGYEMGRAQIFQAQACGVEPDVRMNPILIKPQSPGKSQLIRMGKLIKTYSAKEYYNLYKTNLKIATKALISLKNESNCIVIEGAGSPAEINLQSTDIVNMRIAEETRANVVIIGDIDRGGVFAWLKGTYDLIQSKHRSLIKGFLINKFRGDITLLKPGINMFKKYVPIPIIGVIPWKKFDIDDEDSQNLESKTVLNPKFRIIVLKLPYISNFTDFDAFKQIEDISLKFTTKIKELDEADLIVIPGSKNTLYDMNFLNVSGLAKKIKNIYGRTWIMGICGGYQMLGENIKDPLNMESGGSLLGLGLIPIQTILKKKKILVKKNYEGKNIFDGIRFSGYEIHLGDSSFINNFKPKALVQEESNLFNYYPEKKIFGTYIHGIFESPKLTFIFLKYLSGIDFKISKSLNEIREEELDKLADLIEENCDVSKIIN